MTRLQDLLYDIRASIREASDRGFDYTEPKRIEIAEKRLSQIEDRMTEMGKDIDLDELYQKARTILNGDKLQTLSNREIRNLPFVFNRMEADVAFVRNAVKQYLVVNRIFVFRRILYVYFNCYNQTSSKTQYLKELLIKTLKKNPEINQHIPFLQKEKKLLYQDVKVMATGFFHAHGIREYLKSIEFPESLYGSQFVIQAILHAFNRSGADAASLMELLKEGTTLYENLNLYPFIAESLILAVNESQNHQYRDALVRCLFQHMKDPRYENQSQWKRVSPKAKLIFLSWLRRNDFEIFFGLIEKTAGSTYEGDRMWRYRRAFWEAYLDDMYYTRVILGPAALRLARVELHKEALNYAVLSGIQDGTQSLLMFTIGQYTFIEVSHNGSLRIFKYGEEPIPFIEKDKTFYRREYTYQQVKVGYALETIRHGNADRYSWQSKVSDWIGKHCGVYHSKEQWRLK